MSAPKDPADLVGSTIMAAKVIDAAHVGAPAVPVGTRGRVTDYDESESLYHVGFGDPWGTVLCAPSEIAEATGDSSYGNLRASSIVTLAATARDAGLLQIADRMLAIADRLEAAEISDREAAEQLTEEAGLCAFRAKILDTLGDELTEIADACRRAGAS